jgi:hypothetical protein
MPVLLLTDIFVFLLVGLLLAFGLYAARREHLRAPWRRVVAEPGGDRVPGGAGQLRGHRFAGHGPLPSAPGGPGGRWRGGQVFGGAESPRSLAGAPAGAAGEDLFRALRHPSARHGDPRPARRHQPAGLSAPGPWRGPPGGAGGRAGPGHHADEPVRPDEGSGPLGPGDHGGRGPAGLATAEGAGAKSAAGPGSGLAPCAARPGQGPHSMALADRAPEPWG